ncbi:tRNA-intron lyase [Methanobacterium alkalithermotolerans]|uniref:tRNA-splicing endonuclease n=1 Tax=Methanobacterium alkalithermotolerans TaxID=2731220 RepID=A0A8T8K309_9EURY|nr:tRNA-intron lyase [Methanobacterium alkalithermotolerans]QUH22279.1 tRNA-intron lyase [Methanobacterium alkalithermotolerans]
MRSELSNDLVTVISPKAEKLNQKSHYGRMENEQLELSLIEALYLLDKEKISIFSKDKELSREEMTGIIKDKDLYSKYLVFKDLRNRGYIVKTGFKYGSEFRLYERGKSPGEGHSDYLVNVISENYDLNVLDFSSYVRVAHGVNKKLLMAVVDEEGDITYYNVEWIRP